MEIDWSAVLFSGKIDARVLTPAEHVMFSLLHDQDAQSPAQITQAIENSDSPVCGRAVRAMIKRWEARGFLKRGGSGNRVSVRLARTWPVVTAEVDTNGRPDGITEEMLAKLNELIAVLRAHRFPVYRDLRAERIIGAYRVLASESGDWVRASDLRSLADHEEHHDKSWARLLRAYADVGLLEVKEGTPIRVRLAEDWA